MYKKVIKCSVGVIAYNEEGNIAKLLDALLYQTVAHARIAEIIVISSGSTDNTDTIVGVYERNHKKVRLVTQPERLGKASAVNLFIDVAKYEVLVLVSADVLPEKGTVESLVRPFYNHKVGMSGGRPVPTNMGDDFLGFAVKLMWKLHHEMSIFQPKLGEMVAFRKVFKNIPENSAVDEASIEAIITACGYETVYVANAIVNNKGPLTMEDFKKQRRRIAIGHLWLKKNTNYKVTSGNIPLLLWLYFYECMSNPKDFLNITNTLFIEATCRLQGYIDFRFKGANPFIWDMVARDDSDNT